MRTIIIFFTVICFVQLAAAQSEQKIASAAQIEAYQVRFGEDCERQGRLDGTRSDGAVAAYCTCVSTKLKLSMTPREWQQAYSYHLSDVSGELEWSVVASHIASIAPVCARSTLQDRSERISPISLISPGYFLTAALDKKCSIGDSARAAALRRYRDHFLEGVKLFRESVKPSREDLEKFNDMVANGLPSQDQQLIDAFVERFTPEGISGFCMDAAARIERVIAAERDLRDAYRRQQDEKPK